MAVAPSQPLPVAIYPTSTADWINEHEEYYGEISSQPQAKPLVHPVSFFPKKSAATTTNGVVAVAPAPDAVATAAAPAGNIAVPVAAITVNNNYSLSRLHPGFIPEPPESPDGISSKGSYFSQPSSNGTALTSGSLELERAAVKEHKGEERRVRHSDRKTVGNSGTGRSGVGGASSGAKAHSVPPAAAATTYTAAVHHVEPRRIATGSYNHDDPEDLYADTATRESSSYVWRVLVYLTVLNPFLCFVNALYTFAFLLLRFALSPLRLLSPNIPPVPVSLTTYLTYPLSLHLRFLYPRPQQLPLPEDLAANRLVTVHLFGPLLCLPFSICAGFMVLVWLYTEVLLGEKNDAAGPEYRSLIFTKRHWEGFVLSALKPGTVEGS